MEALIADSKVTVHVKGDKAEVVFDEPQCVIIKPDGEEFNQYG